MKESGEWLGAESLPRIREQRSRLFTTTGQSAVVWCAALFALFLGREAYQIDNWKSYYFHDAAQFGDQCLAASLRSESLGAFPKAALESQLAPIAVPHGRGYFPSRGNLPIHVLYRCQLSLASVLTKPGALWLHLGWVFADRSRLSVNGVERLLVFGDDKLSVPLSASDRENGALSMDLEVSSASPRRVGLSGVQPLTVVAGATENFAILGLETALELGAPQGNFVAQSVLALLVGLGWALGMRTRVMHVALIYFALASTRYFLVLMRNFLPISPLKSGVVGLPLLFAAGLVFLVLLAEVARLQARWLRYALFGVVTVGVLAAGVLATYPGVFPYAAACMYAWHGIMVACTALLLRRLTRVQVPMSRSILAVGGATIAVHGVDIALRFFQTGIYLYHYFDLLVPLVVGAIVVVDLVSVQRLLTIERARNATVGEQLALGRAAQDLLLPPTKTFAVKGVRAHFAYCPTASLCGDWIASWVGVDGTAYLCLGDVVGHGPQAALAATAIQALIRGNSEHASAGPRALAAKIDRTLADMFGRYLLTTFSACAVAPDGKVALYNYGGMGWLIWDGQSARYHALPGAPLGTGRGADGGEFSCHLPKGAMVFTFSDGVCQGSRALKQWLAACERLLKTPDPSALPDQMVAAAPAPRIADDRCLLLVEAA